MMHNQTAQDISIDIEFDQASCLFCNYSNDKTVNPGQEENALVKKIPVSMKIYRSKLIHEILNAHSSDEVKCIINENILRIQKQDQRENISVQYISFIVEELNDLKGSAIANEYYMNLSTARMHLKQLFSR
ncbi:MAG TPA: hypothetical protein VJ499_05905 [Flavisolibacter sp.]|nr:hypothetical protein [Flavisolibacter sp.]